MRELGRGLTRWALARWKRPSEGVMPMPMFYGYALGPSVSGNSPFPFSPFPRPFAELTQLPGHPLLPAHHKGMCPGHSEGGALSPNSLFARPIDEWTGAGDVRQQSRELGMGGWGGWARESPPSPDPGRGDDDDILVGWMMRQGRGCYFHFGSGEGRNASPGWIGSIPSLKWKGAKGMERKSGKS
jgi:hypothetical protein